MTTGSTHGAGLAQEWSPSHAGRGVLPALLPTLIGVLLGMGALVVALRAAGVPGIVAAGGVGLVIVGFFGWVLVQGRVLLSSVGARLLADAEHPRLRNLVAGLARDAGIGAPELYLYEGGANALVCWKGCAVAAFSSAFLSSLSRTELEAVAAHCLVRAPRSWALNLAAAFPWTRSSLDACDLHAADRAAAALTRYPPALAAALGKAEPRATRAISFWFVPSGDPHELDDRVAQLLDL